MKSIFEQATHVIDRTLYPVLATVTADGKPWNTPVYAVRNDQFNFYWKSWIGAQHSQNIRDNGAVFITIFDSTRELGTNHRECVYIEAEARQIENREELEQALQHFPADRRDATELCGDSVKRLYVATPKRVWLNDKSESEVTAKTIKMRLEVPLDELRDN